jgi:hypothetical protein
MLHALMEKMVAHVLDMVGWRMVAVCRKLHDGGFGNVNSSGARAHIKTVRIDRRVCRHHIAVVVHLIADP